MHLAVQDRFGVFVLFKRGHHGFNALGVIAVGNQKGIGSVHHQQVLHPQGDHSAVRGVDEGVAALMGEARAHNVVAVLVLGCQVGHGRPTAHIAPLALKRHHHDGVVVLHDGVVDALARTHLQCRRLGPHKTQGLRCTWILRGQGFGGCVLNGLFTRVQNVRGVGSQGLEERVGTGEKNPRVPQILATQNISLRNLRGGLFNKTQHRCGSGCAVLRCVCRYRC